MTACEYVLNPNRHSDTAVIKVPVGRCACGEPLFDRRSVRCSECHTDYHWEKLTLEEALETMSFNIKWEEVHGMKHCITCARSYEPSEPADGLRGPIKCTLFSAMENCTECKEFKRADDASAEVKLEEVNK